MSNSEHVITHLAPQHAAAIVACFERAYAGTYANETFADARLLADAMRAGRVRCVGALAGEQVVAHMAMTDIGSRQTSELGNTVVDPAARGAGIAWQVGRELTQWCREAGFTGFLHYPTTDHHIMQRQSVKQGFETGLMLGYIPAETDGQVNRPTKHLRQAATVVYEPLAEAPVLDCYAPAPFAELLIELCEPTGLKRRWLSPGPRRSAPAQIDTAEFTRRGLQRITVHQSGHDLEAQLVPILGSRWDCVQIDLRMSDPALAQNVDVCLGLGAKFCAWLPGFADTDVLRLQWVDAPATDMAPGVVNPVAQRILRGL